MVRVSIRVLYIGLFLCTFCLSSYASFFIFPSRYFFAIGLLIIFSFGCLYHPFILHYQAILLLQLVTSMGYHHLWLLFPGDSFMSFTLQLIKLPLELIPVRSPLLRKSKFVSFPALNDMLKFRAYSYITMHYYNYHNLHYVYRILYVGHRLRNLSIPYIRLTYLNYLSALPNFL